MQPSIGIYSLPIGPAPRRRALNIPAPQYCAGFTLFLLTTVILFVRPADFLPSLGALPIYNILIVAALLASVVPMVKLFGRQSLKDRPYILGVVALLPAILLSHLTHGDVYDARVDTFEFAKVVAYFLLLLAVVDSPARLRYLLICLTLCILVTAILALLQHHGLVDMEGLSGVRQWMRTEGEGGELDYVIRLQGAGIFHDPNDLSLVLVMGILLGIYFLLEYRSWPWRINAALAIGILVYALMMTRSRGGFLSMMAGLFVLMVHRWGWRKSLLLGAIALPALMLLTGGRQTQINLTDTDDTAQARILIWRDTLVVFHHAPIFGIGYGRLVEEIGRVTHNSFLHAYAEIGLVGGTIFVGVFYVLIARVRQTAVAVRHRSNELLVWRPYVLAILWAMAVGLCSLSRCYSLPTYVVFGLSAVFCLLATDKNAAPVVPHGWRLYRNIAGASAGCLALLHIFVRVLA